MDQDVLFLVDTSTIEFAEKEGESTWVHALPVGEYSHPVYGKIDMGFDKIQAYADGVKKKVRGIELSINKLHGTNGGDGEAVGWIKDADPRPNGLWLQVDFTEDAKQDIKNKKWRYFSAEFQEKWKDATGKIHENVLFGGALTNRPYMKNLLPLNLSENTIDTAVELAEIIKSSKTRLQEEDNPKEEQEMDLKKLSELLGLPEGSTEETVVAKLAELKGATPPQPTKPTVPQVINLSEELKSLSEENPLVKTLLDTLDLQQKALGEHNIALREAEVARKLAEFDKSKIVLTPRAKDLVHDLTMDMPVELHERFWELLGLMRASSAVMVELGERAGNSVKYGRSKDARVLFLESANAVAAEKKISLTEAMGVVAANDPELYNGYRHESFSFRD